MKEQEVKEVIEKWVKLNHPDWVIWSTWNFDIVSGPAKHLPTLAIECKGITGKRSSFQRAIGQCLDYMVGRKLTVCVAIPDDYVYKDQLLRVVNYHNLPIGILTISDKQEVGVLRQPPR